MDWDAWCKAYPADSVTVKPDEEGLIDRFDAEQRKDFREMEDEIAYRVVTFDGLFYVVPVL